MTAFLIALALLLVVPGPTNTVLAMAGAERGFARALPLAAVVLAGYLTTVVPVVTLAAPFLEAKPVFADGTKLAAAAWVLVLALRLWSRQPRDHDAAAISAMSIYTTTVLNPKGLVIGLALLPPVQAMAGSALPVFALAGAVLAISGLWLGLGATAIATLNRRHPVLVSRAASGCLIVFSASLAAKAMGLV